MLNSDSQKPSDLEESKEKKVDINKEAEFKADRMRKSQKLKESNAHDIESTTEFKSTHW